ncbi:hypothetical protein P4O66_013915 [Electrophorus voltai]|uniref:Rho-GAP domain-containing protein n=1 Tax=Electrophorus voltai TaxID=2609070 RepID=A0AAD9DSV5_9TELE|nr:hypothetical protein P4O66_013915 [Electrophorus voltai]
MMWRRAVPMVDCCPFLCFTKHNRAAVQIREDMKKMVHPPMAQPWHGPAPARPSGSPGVFGVALLDVRELGLVKDGVPMVMRTMVEYLRQHGLEQEGLFRVSGSVRAVDGLRRRLDSREQWVELGQEVEVCTVASLLKQYLRELPEGLVHPSVQNALIQLQQESSEDDFCKDVRSLLQRLPDVHYSVLRYLCHFLTQVEQQQNSNRMTALNLATVFGPNIFHVSPGFDGMHEQSVCNKITATLIQNYSAIFGPDEGAERAETEALNVILVKVGAATSVSSLMQPIRVKQLSFSQIHNLCAHPIRSRLYMLEAHMDTAHTQTSLQSPTTEAPSPILRKKLTQIHISVANGYSLDCNWTKPLWYNGLATRNSSREEKDSPREKDPRSESLSSTPRKIKAKCEVAFTSLPQPVPSSGFPHSRQPVERSSSPRVESTGPGAEHMELGPPDLSPVLSAGPLSSSQEDERPISPFYMSSQISPGLCRPALTHYLERTIRSAVQQHLFDVHMRTGQRSPQRTELTGHSSSPMTTARERRRQQREQAEIREKCRDDTDKENIPSTGLISPRVHGSAAEKRLCATQDVPRARKPRHDAQSPEWSLSPHSAPVSLAPFSISSTLSFISFFNEDHQTIISDFNLLVHLLQKQLSAPGQHWIYRIPGHIGAGSSLCIMALLSNDSVLPSRSSRSHQSNVLDSMESANNRKPSQLHTTVLFVSCPAVDRLDQRGAARGQHTGFDIHYEPRRWLKSSVDPLWFSIDSLPFDARTHKEGGAGVKHAGSGASVCLGALSMRPHGPAICGRLHAARLRLPAKPQTPAMKIQECLSGPEPSEHFEDVPRLDLTALTEDADWGEPVPAYSSWQRESMDRDEARLSPHAGGRLIRQLLDEGEDPMLSPRFYAYGGSEQYLDDPEVPPSPPNAHSFISRRRSSSLGSCDDDREELSTAQLSKKIHGLKRKIRKFEEKFEEERKYRPSHSDKAANSEVLRWMNELAKLRKELKEHRLLKSEEDLIPLPRQRSNTLPKSFGSQLERKVSEAKALSTPAESTLDSIMNKLQEKRAEVSRPEDIKASGRAERCYRDMTREQIVAEKVALQKALLYYEGIHGRPVTKAERQLMKPLYDRYRLVKQILCRPSTIPVIGSPSSKRRAPHLQPIIEGEPALFFDHFKEEEDGSDEDNDNRTQVTHLTGRPELSMLGLLEHLDEEVDGFISPVDDLSPSKNTTDMRLSNLHAATTQELVEQLQEAREEKKRIRKSLREFEDQFFRQNGRNVQKEDRTPLAVEYNEYKHIKAKLKLLEVLISKRDSSKFI